MPKTFTGDVLLPGEVGSGLAATLTLDPERVTLTSGDNQLGSWDRSDYLIAPEQNGSFNLTLGGESVLFRPDSPSEFAGASEIPLAAAVSSHAQVLRPLVKDETTTISTNSWLTSSRSATRSTTAASPTRSLL